MLWLSVFFNLIAIAKLFPECLDLWHFPAATDDRSRCSGIWPCLLILILCLSNRCVVVPHYGFDLHLRND